MWLLAAFLAIPLIEIALFIRIGGLIGLWPTLLVVVLTAVFGTVLVRREGLRALADLQRALAEFDDPTRPLADGAAILFAGALLLTPGFFTDAVGFLLLVPRVRHAAFRWLRTRVTVRGFAHGPRPPQPGTGPEIIEGEFEELPPDQRPTHRPSGWTQH